MPEAVAITGTAASYQRYTASVHLKNAVHEFLTHCEVGRYLSRKTLENYRHYLRRFQAFAGRKLAVEDIDRVMIQRYRLHLNNLTIPGQGVGLGIKTQQYHLIALRAFLKYLAKNDHPVISAEKVELPKVPSRAVEALSREELEEMFHVIDPSSRNGLRDLALLHLLFSTGLRVSELSSLNRSDVNVDKGEFRVIGKGRKPRIAFLSGTAKVHVKNYLDARTDHWKPLLVSNANRSKADTVIGDTGRRLEPQAIQRIMRNIAVRAAILKKVTPHVIRHTFATELLRNGADIRSVQELLGHASITTTQIYTHLTNQRLREVHSRYHR